MLPNIHFESQDVAAQLAALGTDEESLRSAVARGQLAFASCTPNHPRMFRAIYAWAETVRGLRENHVIKGWTNSDDKNYSLALDPEGQLAIAVATGNEATGQVDSSPCTKSSKGPSTVEAVLINQAQMDLFADMAGMAPPPAVEVDDQDRATWILLIHRTGSEVRCELSLPVSIGADMRINQWQERIILRPITLDPEPVVSDITPPLQPDIDVQIKRKA
jgi:hypothetical protein